MTNILGLQNGKLIADYHIHFGQFYNVYYQPSTVISVLAACGVKTVWGSSTTACLRWKTDEEKKYILTHIEDEIKEALFVAERRNVELKAFYRVIPKLHFEGVRIEKFMDNAAHYNGFKIHPLDEGYEDKSAINELMEEVCEYASKYRLPILIHTGENGSDAPDRFEKFFEKFDNVHFVIAHCKQAMKVISLFQKYDNIFGDTAFCSKDSFNLICECGYANKMRFGTDFPATHWFFSAKKSLIPSRKELLNDYKWIIKGTFF